MDSARPYDVERWRRRFPGLARQIDGQPIVHLDGPAGSQVPDTVIQAVSRQLGESNANTGGMFVTSHETDAVLAEAHAAAADLLGAADADCIVFGPNMTCLTLTLARALAADWGPGDEIVVTRLEHDANFTPWVLAVQAAGATVRASGVRRADCTLDLEDLARQVGPRTRLVAVTAASNCVGTVPPLSRIVELAHAAGALVFVDAVHHAPHRLVDVQAWGCDFVACSAYKFFGPHVGILWGRRELLSRLPVARLRPVPDTLPQRFMPGTQNHEGLAGTLAAIDYLAELGRAHDPLATSRRAALASAYAAIEQHEHQLTERLLDGLRQLPGVEVWGITDRARAAERVATVSFTHRRAPGEIAELLARRAICVWHGNFYALPLTEALGLEPHGLVRVGLLHYNTEREVDRLLEALAELD